MIFATCFPPLIGYGTLLYFCGFVFKFPWGFFPAFIGPFFGAAIGFPMGRKWLKTYRDMLVRHYPNFAYIESAVDQGGLKLLVLIRLAPYPFGLGTLLLSSTRIEYKTFLLGTAIGLCKNIIHVYIGSTIDDLTDVTKSRNGFQIFILACNLCMAVGVFVYITRRVRKVLKEARISEEEIGVYGAASGAAEEELNV